MLLWTLLRKPTNLDVFKKQKLKALVFCFSYQKHADIKLARITYFGEKLSDVNSFCELVKKLIINWTKKDYVNKLCKTGHNNPFDYSFNHFI